MKNIHVLHTDKPSILFYLNSTLRLEFSTVERKTNQHIYITNDDNIKEGDWYLDTIINTLFKSKIFLNVGYKKIILTTDLDLIKDGVQYIDDVFLEWFIKNPSCEEVEVDIKSVFDKVDGHYHDLWEVIISIEEPLHLLSCCKSLEECHCGKSSKLEESWGDIINKWLEYYHNYTNGQGLKMTEWLEENYNPPIKK